MWYTNAEGDNMRLKRKIDEYLIEWKKSKNKMPLIVKDVIAEEIGEKTPEEIEEDFKKLYIF